MPVRLDKRFEGLDDLIEQRGTGLLATAVLLAGSRTAGEDLLQSALERLMRHWNRLEGDKEAYLRRVLYNLAIDERRIRRRRPEVHVDAEPPGRPDGTDVLHLRHELIGALARLPPRQRAVLVLRYWEQLTEAESAQLLGCSIGTVKSSASRGLNRLREVMSAWEVEDARI
jgi:RNA polymerase sigma-70 factor (sigma-E family)